MSRQASRGAERAVMTAGGNDDLRKRQRHEREREEAVKAKQAADAAKGGRSAHANPLL